MRAVMVERAAESTEDCNKVREDIVRLKLIYTWGSMSFFSVFHHHHHLFSSHRASRCITPSRSQPNTVCFALLPWLHSSSSFLHFTVKKKKVHLPAERLACLYIKWFAYLGAICGCGKVGLWKK